jgi:hypothetical protein
MVTKERLVGYKQCILEKNHLSKLTIEMVGKMVPMYLILSSIKERTKFLLGL